MEWSGGIFTYNIKPKNRVGWVRTSLGVLTSTIPFLEVANSVLIYLDWIRLQLDWTSLKVSKAAYGTSDEYSKI